MYAHYTQGSKTRPATVRLTRDVAGRELVYEFACDGKRHARNIAAANNAKPWNF